MNRASLLLRTGIFGPVTKRSKSYVTQLKTSMNDLPQPCGNWQTQHDANQRKYNLLLIGGIGFFILTITFGKATGCFYFNATVPDYPAEKNDYSK